MKKILLASTALAASVAVSAPAMAADGVSWSGFSNFVAGNSDSDAPVKFDKDGDLLFTVPISPSLSDFDYLDHYLDRGMDSLTDFGTKTEVHFTYSKTADNGLEYGAKIEFQADQNDTDNVDEAYVFLKGDWGQIQLGDNDGAADQLKIVATPGFVPGMVNNDTGAVFATGALKFGVKTATDLSDGSDSTKITYLTPSFSGFKAGISYTPNAADGNGDSYDDDTERAKNMVGLGVKYSHDFDGVTLDASGTTVFYKDDQDKAVKGYRGDYRGYNLGAELGFSGFKLAASFANQDYDYTGDVNTYAAGASYSAGPITVSGGGVLSKSDYDSAPVALKVAGLPAVAVGPLLKLDGSSVDQKMKAYSLGVNYVIVPGLSASLGGTMGTTKTDIFSEDVDWRSVVAGVHVSF